tara:strand:- start:1439 stop:1825 length:387 start_codon:yes stop_codon:yes gene_type:complete
MGIIRITKSVDVLLNEFKTDSMALSAIELVRRLSKKLNKTTIYRVLDKLVDEGVLHSFNGRDGIKWYAKCTGCSLSGHTDAHPHFQCLSCGKMDCLTDLITIPELSHRKIVNHQTLIQGQCELCIHVS